VDDDLLVDMALDVTAIVLAPILGLSGRGCDRAGQNGGGDESNCELLHDLILALNTVENYA
jgi:hypothetical protein